MTQFSRVAHEGDEKARLETELEWQRARVAVSLGELRRRIHRVLRGCHWLFHPVARIAIGLSLGFLMARRDRKARNRRRRPILFSACRQE